ncbi:hypothetical protein GCM10020331_042600 [Ectobacillus funiculus]
MALQTHLIWDLRWRRQQREQFNSIFEDLGRSASDYDLIVTGDLSAVGTPICRQMLLDEGYDMGSVYNDCGLLLYGPDQEVFAGGSGCACSAVVTYGHLLQEMRLGNLNRLLVVATGALLNPIMVQQKESIPTIAHGVVFERVKRSVMEVWSLYMPFFGRRSHLCSRTIVFLDITKLTPAHLMASFVVLGAILDGFGLYDNLIRFAGAGATVPITSFGHSLMHGAMQEAKQHGYLGLGMGMFFPNICWDFSCYFCLRLSLLLFF